MEMNIILGRKKKLLQADFLIPAKYFSSVILYT